MQNLSSIHEILFGEMPYGFLLEVILRSFVVYLILIFSIRAMGKRMASQLGRNDLAAMVSLAAAIGIPIQDAERGLLPTVVIALVIIAFQRYIAYKSAVNEKFEKYTQGLLYTLVDHGVIQIKTLKKAGLGRERILARLRSEGVIHLGQVEKLFLEANGSFSLRLSQNEKSGLPIIPDWDTDFLNELQKSSDDVVCKICGHSQDSSTAISCGNCTATSFVLACSCE